MCADMVCIKISHALVVTKESAFEIVHNIFNATHIALPVPIAESSDALDVGNKCRLREVA